MEFRVSEETIQMILDYLGRKPYVESAPIIEKLQAGLVPLEKAAEETVDSKTVSDE